MPDINRVSMPREILYSAVVPVYESSSSVKELTRRLCAVLDSMAPGSYEVILVDDGSLNPETWPTLAELSQSSGAVTAIRLTRNFGRAAAVLCGTERSSGRWVVILDDDLQHQPEDIRVLAEHKSHDVVIGHFPVRQHSYLVKLSSRIKSYFDKVLLGLPHKISPFLMINGEVARAMLKIRTPRPFLPALLIHITTDFYSVNVGHERSSHGKSRYTFWRRLGQFTNLLISNSSFLMHLFGSLGAAVACSGFAMMLWILVRKLSGGYMQAGWASLAAINLLFGGLILLALGVMGEYLLRILEGSSGKPAYLVKEINAGSPRENR